jgi:osmotically-inducible protein OsmY
MKTPKLFALLLLAAATPMTLLANSTDDQIESAAKASYNYQTVLHDKVNVSVDDGVVTLTGTVQDKDLKSLAQDTVEDLPGVMRVQNDIKVEPAPPEHSDAWIALKVRTSLLMHANVSIADTQVEVQAGVVTLTGTVDSVAQKELTDAYVKQIEGVKDVDDQLVVKQPPEAEEPRTASAIVDDSSITARVKYELLSHRSTSALSTSVKTHDGNVVIKGEAGSDAEKALVTQLAQGVKGVHSVDNRMTVKDGD